MPSSLLLSAYRYEKDGHTYYAGLDTSTATVRIYSIPPINAHGLIDHFKRTTADSTGDIAAVINAALSDPGNNATPHAESRTFIFMPTSHCNMGCSYCGQSHSPGNTSSAVSSRFFERVQAAFHQPNIRQIHVGWFGGEPLLAYRSIMELSVRFVALARETGRQYSSKMPTNGALLTSSRMKQLVEDANVQRFDITLDGPPEIHNRHRPLKAGGASFEKIVRTLTWFRDTALTQPAFVVLRTNVDKENLAYISDYLQLMKKLGFDNSKKFAYELAPIHSWGNDISGIALTTVDAARWETKWMRLMEELGLRYDVLPGRPATRTCVATQPDSEVIDRSGNLFSCTETALTPQADADLLANIISLPLLARRPRGQFEGWDQAVEKGAVPCSTCQLRYICRGACPKQWSEGTVACPTIKLNFDDRLAIFMQRHGYYTADASS